MMPFGRYTHTLLGFLTLASFLIGPVANAQTVTMDDFHEAKETFEKVWHSAAENVKRRSELEESLPEFEARVAQAKKELQEVTGQQDALQMEITEKQRFIVTLSEQIRSVSGLRGFYQSVIARRLPGFLSLLRSLVGRQIARSESGVVHGGAILRALAKEPIGESVEDQLFVAAAIRARALIVSQAGTLLAEARKTEERLHGVALDLTKELAALEEKRNELKKAADEKHSIIDLSWKEKKLTEEELREVAAETAEATEQIAKLQENLVAIHEELKERELNALKDDLKLLEDERAAVQAKRDALKRREDALRLLEEGMLHAKQRTVTERNTDPRLYKRVEVQEFALKSAKGTLSSGTMPTNDPDAPTRPLTEDERTKLEREVRWFTDLLALMKDGVPEGAASDYLKAAEQAKTAPFEREKLREELAQIQEEHAEIGQRISAKLSEVETVEHTSILADFPLLFVWPVRGPISAGYLDPDYENVFHVPHRGMDIAVAQGTPVRSISDGVVFAVKDGGATGYSYLLIGHRNGYASLYGHLLRFRVKKGDIVNAGQWVADSGGIRNTPGAGYQTTGAHLHLEVMENGEHIDPRSVLP